MNKKQAKRRKKRLLFVKSNISLFVEYQNIEGHKPSSHPLVKKIAKKARKKIKYSCKTVDCDIVWTLYRTYLEL